MDDVFVIGDCGVDLRAMHKEIRENIYAMVKSRGIGGDGVMAVLKGGEQTRRYDTDKDELFRQESFFHHIFGVKEADCWGLLDLEKYRAILLIPRLDPEWAIWEGQIRTPESFMIEYGVDEVRYVDELEVLLEGISKVQVLSGTNTDSGSGFDTPWFNFTCEVEKNELMSVLVSCRTIKTDMEIEVLQYVNDVTSAAHKYVMRCIEPGNMFEYQLESLFLHYCSYHMQARFVPYSCICCAGETGAVLHYGGASSPLPAKVEDGDMCLLDMGTEHHCYCSDITCSYPANGVFTDDQKLIYRGVYDAQRAVERACKPGVEWSDLHLLAERVILENLVEAGILVGDVIEMQENRVSAVFMPHGLGHMMGLDVHDCGGFGEGRGRLTGPSLRNLRANIILQEQMVLTNEPGTYFIRTLIDAALADDVLSKYIVEERVRHFLDQGFGGIRLEDDLVVTSTGCRTMTKVPRTIEEVEAWMSLEKFPGLPILH